MINIEFRVQLPNRTLKDSEIEKYGKASIIAAGLQNTHLLDTGMIRKGSIDTLKCMYGFLDIESNIDSLVAIYDMNYNNSRNSKRTITTTISGKDHQMTYDNGFFYLNLDKQSHL